MDVDAVAVGEGSDSPNWRERRGGLSETERKERQQEGRCFLCGRQGHMRRACPKRGEGGNRKEGTTGDEEGKACAQQGWKEMEKEVSKKAVGQTTATHLFPFRIQYSL